MASVASRARCRAAAGRCSSRESLAAAAAHSVGCVQPSASARGQRVGRGVVPAAAPARRTRRTGCWAGRPRAGSCMRLHQLRSVSQCMRYDDDHRPLEQRRLQRGRAAGDQRHVAGGERRVRLAVERSCTWRRRARPARRSWLDARAAAPASPGTTKRRPGRAACSSAAAATRRRGAMYSISERAAARQQRDHRRRRRRRPSARARRARGRRRSGITFGERMADVGRRDAVLRAAARARTGTCTARGRRRARIFLMRSPRQAQIDGLTKCTVVMPARLAGLLSRPRLKSGASTPMKTSGRSRSRRSRSCVADAARSRGSAAAPRRSRAPRASRAATRRSKPCARHARAADAVGLQLRASARAGLRSSRPAEQVAGGFAGDHARARGAAGHAAQRDDAARGARRGSRASARRRRRLGHARCASAAMRLRASSSVRPSRYSSLCICLTRARCARRVKPRRAGPRR